jgi:hypothetical protein
MVTIVQSICGYDRIGIQYQDNLRPGHPDTLIIGPCKSCIVVHIDPPDIGKFRMKWIINTPWVIIIYDDDFK